MPDIAKLGIETPAVMGVLNVTPDSFSDGGRFATVDAAIEQGVRMAAEGAAIIDIGGESTRPGAAAVSEQEELDRVIPVIEALRARVDSVLSIDTSKPGVMREAQSAGAGMINDVFALRMPGALETAAGLGLPVCLMHMQGEPRTMQQNPRYTDVVAEVTGFLADRVAQCEKAGLDRGSLIVDPGFGFGKTPEHNLRLLARLRELERLGCPVLIGISRKATLGALTGRDVDDRLAASVAAAVVAYMNGAGIVRVHDVAPTVDALSVARAVTEADADK